LSRRPSSKTYNVKKRRRKLRALQIEAKIHALKSARKPAVPKPISEREKHLLKAVMDARRAAYFECLELELVNHQRAMTGLPPLKSVPPDTPQARKIMRMEREMMGILERL
jgi:hypothetical protein